MTVVLDELTLADAPDAWHALGFAVHGETSVVGGVRLRFAGPGAGKRVAAWALRGLEDGAPEDLDGLATSRSERPPAAGPPHPNGVASVDHVVAISSDLDRTASVLRGAGLDLRRVREEPTPAGAPRQAFFRIGEAILELVQEPAEATERAGGDRPAFFWGLALRAPDLEATVAAFGDAASPIRPAVQPGRHIATVRRSAGLAVPLALISPPT